MRYRQEALDWYTAFLDQGVRADVIPVWTDLPGYDLVVAPILHMVPSALRDRLTAYAEGGGNLVATYFSGIVDENDHVWLGGCPGALRELLGIRVEEFEPRLDDTLRAERVHLTDPATEVLFPEVTRRPVGDGSAAYVSARLGPEGLAPVLAELLARAGVEPELPPGLRGKVELAIRGGVRFHINRTDFPLVIDGADLPGRGVLIVE
ncbi:beta-galactosidase trimerization domain-containing protein [Actinoplanes hulinensis]|uniref:beta-galactosidase trimerization domain-containing protein n=1 Tax=Actinoplanes hulinensis TaxID=1144547 RepID=UPI001FE6A8BD|nr:beta-galactosidase trimerization domain-containing protein [Actinoplanes hulinensis]